MNLPKLIWQIRGKEAGPNAVILGGTHGDELAGIEVVRKILGSYDVLNRPSGVFASEEVKGNLFVGFGNPEAILRKTRWASGPEDLNRCFVPEKLGQTPQVSDSLDLRRARELSELLRQTDLLIDLHATSNQSDPFICSSSDSLRHRQIFSLIPVRYFLTDPDRVLPKEFSLPVTGTTDFYANHFGGVGICYETGQDNDLSVVDLVLVVLKKILVKQGIIRPDSWPNLNLDIENIPRVDEQKIFALQTAVVAKKDSFVYSPGLDRSWVHVQKGQILGHYPDGEPEVISHDGMLVMPKAATEVRAGRKLYFLAREV